MPKLMGMSFSIGINNQREYYTIVTELANTIPRARTLIYINQTMYKDWLKEVRL
jgi:hypothetical protein